MADIKPIDIPSAAGVDFGNGDVRHFSEADTVSVPGLQPPTRHLAARDNKLADKLNEVISVVNNKEQIVPLPVTRIAVGPATEEVITNYRIPPGYEARVLNAIVGTVPTGTDVLLKVYYAANSYGATAGTEILSTSSENTAGTQFYSTGEFIVALRNAGSATLDCVACVTLTVRPVGSQASLLVGSVVRGEQGPPGPTGSKGDAGNSGGSGSAGTPGLIWKGTWSNVTAYSAPTDVVAYTVAGATNSYVCIQSNTGQTPTNTAYWSVVAAGGTGASFNPRGTFNSANSYAVNDLVDYSGSSYLCILSNPAVSTAPPNATYWQLIAAAGSAGSAPTYSSQVLSATYTATVTSSADGAYGAVAASGSFSLTEFGAVNGSDGIVILTGYRLLNMGAAAVLTITLPTSVIAGTAWANTELTLNAITQGDRTVETTVKLLNVSTVSTNQWVVTVLSGVTQHVTLSFVGVKTF